MADYTSREKPVEFGDYCSKCKYKDKKEYEDPCDDCLDEFTNTDTHRPLYFKEADKK